MFLGFGNIQMPESLIFERFCTRSGMPIATSANARVIILPHNNVVIYFKMFPIKHINLTELNSLYARTLIPKATHIKHRT